MRLIFCSYMYICSYFCSYVCVVLAHMLLDINLNLYTYLLGEITIYLENMVKHQLTKSIGQLGQSFRTISYNSKNTFTNAWIEQGFVHKKLLGSNIIFLTQ